MFYSALYRKLGKLFYHIAAVDGNVQPAEREALERFIDGVWKPLEDSTDEFGTDQAALIDFAFDYENAESPTEDILLDFKTFYQENKEKFTPAIVKSILKTGEAIADAYRGKNKEEKAVLDRIRKILRDN